MSNNLKFSLEMQILNISSNLSRIAQWVGDDYLVKQPLIETFWSQTKEYLVDLKNQPHSERFDLTLRVFSDQFNKLDKTLNQKNKMEWSEKALTWANILQHRAKLA